MYLCTLYIKNNLSLIVTSIVNHCGNVKKKDIGELNEGQKMFTSVCLCVKYQYRRQQSVFY